MRVKQWSSFTMTNLVFLAVLCLLALLLYWPKLTGHRLNGEVCGEPPAGWSAMKDGRDHSGCGHNNEPGERPDWCCY